MQREEEEKPGRSAEACLERLKKRFEEWRGRREVRGPIPGDLLETARGLVGAYPPGPLAKALRLHYRRLTEGKGGIVKRAEKPGRPKRREGVIPAGSVPTFMRVPLGLPGGVDLMERSGMVEFENPGGYKARVFLERAPTALVRELLKGIGGEKR